MRRYPKSSTWTEYLGDNVHLRVPARVAKVCNLNGFGKHVKVEWRFYKTGVNGFRATVQEVKL